MTPIYENAVKEKEIMNKQQKNPKYAYYDKHKKYGEYAEKSKEKQSTSEIIKHAKKLKEQLKFTPK